MSKVFLQQRQIIALGQLANLWESFYGFVSGKNRRQSMGIIDKQVQFSRTRGAILSTKCVADLQTFLYYI